MSGCGRAIVVGGFRGWAVRSGPAEAPAVLILASPFVTARAYLPLARLLSRDHRVVVLEMPGSGRGSRLRPAWDFVAYAHWVSEALDALRLDRPTVIGHSNSGPVALLLGAMYPRRVGRVVLADSVGADPRRSLLAMLIGRLLDLPREMRFNLLAGPGLLANLLRHPRSFGRQLRLCAQLEPLRWARHVRAPVLLAWGGRDATVPLECCTRFHAAIPASESWIQVRGSHDWLVEHAESFADAIRRSAGCSRQDVLTLATSAIR